MIVKLLTEHHLECLSLKGGYRGSSGVYTFQNATLVEISCTDLIIILAKFNKTDTLKVNK